MTLGLTIFTLVHVAISLIGIASGLRVTYGFLTAKRLDGWTATFLTSTVLTSVTGFLFPFLPVEQLGGLVERLLLERAGQRTLVGADLARGLRRVHPAHRQPVGAARQNQNRMELRRRLLVPTGNARMKLPCFSPAARSPSSA